MKHDKHETDNKHDPQNTIFTGGVKLVSRRQPHS